jgi:molecular chaperone GrpE
MGDNEENPGGQDASGTGAESSEVKATPKEASLGDRKNAAKAFYRALYSGEDVVPEEFGIGTKTAEKQAEKGQTHTGPCPNCARLEQEAKESEKKATDNENFYKRIAADFENYRKRNDREREEALGLGMQKAVEMILPALDDLDRAKMSLANVTDPRTVVEALNLVFARFNKCLEPMGVKPMEVVGEHFDPKFHEPVQEVPTKHYADGAVAQELRRGYMMRDKVIRPALVNVASNPSGVIEPLPEPAVPPAPAASTPEPASEVKEAPAPAASESADSTPPPEAKTDTNKPDVGADAKAASEAPAEAETFNADPASADESDSKSGDEPGLETDRAAIDKAANKQRAANALERLRKGNPKATAELPALKPDEMLTQTATLHKKGDAPNEEESSSENSEESKLNGEPKAQDKAETQEGESSADASEKSE